MRFALLLAFFLPGLAQAAPLDAFTYKDSAALRGIWLPQGESLLPEASIGGDQQPAMRLPAPFSGLKDWRFYWDRDIAADLSFYDQVVIKLRSPDPKAVGQVILYFQAGSGWYRLPPFTVEKEWTERVLPLKQAAVEDKPLPWSKVGHMRLALLPGERRDTYVEVAYVGGRSGWPLSHVGSFGPYTDLASASSGILKDLEGSPKLARAKDLLKDAKLLETRASLEKEGPPRQELILQGREMAAKAYALAQSPKEGEFRCVWVHTGDGVRDAKGVRTLRWKEALPKLKEAGFNAVAPNMLWSGTAYYPSSVVPTNSKVKAEGDYLKEILDAAKPLGMQVHLWKVMWQFAEGWLADPGVSEPFRKAGRLQLDAKGAEQPWLCPCDERNRDYEMKAIMEAADKYPVDGIHLDYIRFSGTEVSYSPMCRERFEKSSGKKVAKWPADCVQGGPRFGEYAAFKREVISSFVRDVRKNLKAAHPAMQLSAAVFAYPDIARDSVSQDWPRWAKEGWMDWMSTMTYTEDAVGFKAAVALQQPLMGSCKLYPGIQVTFDEGRVAALETVVDEIRGLRELGLNGFTLFEYRSQLLDGLFPGLKAGLTSR